MADIQNLDIKDFQLYSSVDDNDRVLMAKIDGTDGAITIALLRLQLGAEVKPSIKDGQWYIGKINTNVIAEGKTPEFRTGPEGIECRYVGEDDNAWRVLVGYDKLKLKFTDLTPAQKEELRLKFADLSEADIAELQKPARDVIAVVTKTNTDIKSVEQLRVSAEQARVTAEQGRVTAEQNRVTECGQVITATNTAKEAAITETAKTKLATQAADIATGQLNMALGEVVAAAELAEAAAGSVGEAKAAALGAAVNANNAATNANGAASNANEKAVAAGNAATSANNAAENANSQADAANDAAEAANNAATGANAAKDAANGAAASANNAATGANAAKDAANAAAEAANNAATGANAAKDAANTSAVNANNKAAEAGQAATDADAAAQRAREAAAAAEAKSITKQEVENVLTGEIGSHTHKWEKVTDKPDTFPPATHEHGEYLPRAGGTMTGALEVLSQAGGSHGGAIEIRERDLVGEQQLDWDYSPALSFHWGWGCAARLGLRSDGAMAIDDAVIWHGNNSNTNATDWNVKDLIFPSNNKLHSYDVGDGSLGVLKHNNDAGNLNTGDLLVSNTWADRTKVPANGIYSKGAIKSDSQIIAAGGDQLGWTDFAAHYSYDGALHYYWNKIAKLPSEGLLEIEIDVHGDSNYPSSGRYIASVSTFQGAHISAEFTKIAGSVESAWIAVDKDANVWARVDVAWHSYVRFKVISKSPDVLILNDWYQEAPPADCLVVSLGQGFRTSLVDITHPVLETNTLPEAWRLSTPRRLWGQWHDGGNDVNGKMVVNPSDAVGNFDQGIRVGERGGFSLIMLGAPESDAGPGENAWQVIRNTDNNLVIGNNMEYETGEGLTLYRDGSRPSWRAKSLAYTTDIPSSLPATHVMRREATGDIHTWIPYGSSGLFYLDAYGQKNAPGGGWYYYIGMSHGNANGYIKIVAYNMAPNERRQFEKECADGVWSTWREVAYMDNIPVSKHKSATLPASGWVASGADWAYIIADGDVQDGVTITGDADGDTCDTFDAARIYKSVAAVGSFTLYARNKPAGSINLLYTIQA